MKQMKYRKEWFTEPKVLDSGFYRGYEYYILSLGDHPVAYVVVEEGNKYYGKDYLEKEVGNITCHGGITYSRNYLKGFVKDKWVLGWDYAHYNDFTGIYIDSDINTTKLKKWTTSEIYNHVKFVIHQIIIENAR